MEQTLDAESSSGLVSLSGGWSARWPIPVAPPVSDARIPELRKKDEKDRKGGGLCWATASPGGSGALARAAAGSGGFGVAGAETGRVGASGWLGRLLPSSAAVRLVLGVILAGLGAGAIAGLFMRPAAPESTAGPFPKPSPSLSWDLRSNLAINAPRDRSLPLVSSANRGEINFGEDNPLAPRPELGARGGLVDAPAPLPNVRPPLPESAAEPAAAAANAGGALREFAPLGGQDGGLASGARLPAMTQPFGGFQVQAPSALPPPAKSRPGARGPAKGGSKVPAMARHRGKLAAMPRGAARMNAGPVSQMQASAPLAAGQLKVARLLSVSGEGASTTEAGRQNATDAFEQQVTKGGEIQNAVPSGMGQLPGEGQVVVPPGTGAPDLSAPLPAAPPVGPTVNTTPYQPQLDRADAMAQAAGMLRMMGLMMIAVGIALLVAGGMMIKSGAAMIVEGGKLNIPFPFTAGDPLIAAGGAMKAAGIAMMAAGAGMMAMGFMMMSTAQNLGDQAQQVGKSISQDQGQQTQGQIAADNAQAKANGTAYTPPDMSKQLQNNAQLQQRIQQERNAGYTVGGQSNVPGPAAPGR